MKIRISHISEPICLLILIVFPFLFELQSLFSANIIIGLEFWLIGLLSVSLIFAEKQKGRSFSIIMFSAFFIYIFVFIAGGYQYLNNSFVYNAFITDSDIIHANIAIIVWILFTHLVVWSCRTELKSSILNAEINLSISDTAKMMLIIFCFALGIVNILQNGIQVLFNRYYYNEIVSSTSQSLTSIRKILRSGLGMWTLYICALDYKKNATSVVFVILALISCLMIIPPLATSRTIVFVTYCGFFLIVSDKLKKGMNFFLLVLMLDLFVAPVFNLFRNGFLGDKAVVISTIREYKSSFLMADYDAYTMFLLSIQYVAVKGITWGKQLLSVVFFFVPRSFWPQKAIGSGATIMAALNTARVSNISCPIFAEAYINFGAFGIPLFSAFLGVLICKLDLLYWKRKNSKHSLIKNLYPFLTLFILLVYRGDLLNAYAWLFGYAVVLLLIRILFLRKVQFKSLE